MASEPKNIAPLIWRAVSAWLFYSGKLERQFAEQVKSGEVPPWFILRYEHIVNPEDLAYPIPRFSFVRPKTLEMQLQYLAINFNVLPLDKLAEDILTGKTIPNKTIAITFDGGYLDQYINAYPLLLRYQIPVTFFLPTAYIGTANLFYEDKILFFLLSFMQANQKFPLFPFVEEKFPEFYTQMGEERVITLESIAAFIDILNISHPQHRAIVHDLMFEGVNVIGGLPEYRMFMDWDHLREMAKNGITFGSMSHGRGRFIDYSREELAVDLQASFAKFHEEKISPTKIYSLPRGEESKSLRSFLYSLGIRTALGLGKYWPLRQHEDRVTILGRKPIVEAQTFSKDLFACRLLYGKAFGFEY